MTYTLEITTKSVATLDFETEDDARNWMESWEEQDYNNLDWSDDEATEMVLTKDYRTLLVVYCDMRPDT